MLGDAMIIPFNVGDDPAGRAHDCSGCKDRPRLRARDIDMGVSFAGHISVAIDRAEARSDRAAASHCSRIAAALPGTCTTT